MWHPLGVVLTEPSSLQPDTRTAESAPVTGFGSAAPVAIPRPADRDADAVAVEPRDLRDLVDPALDRMERRALGEERPVPLPWSNVSAALEGGLWGGTLVTLVGDTGTGKTQWALQAAVHAAEAGVPVCYLSPDAGAEQIVARLVALKAGRRWSDVFAGRTGREDVAALREAYADVLKGIPFHVMEPGSDRTTPPRTRALGEWMRRRYPQEKPGTHPFLIVLDFVQMLGGARRDRDDLKDMMAQAAHEARQAARDLDAVVLFVSATARERRPDGDESIGIHRDRRSPAVLGRGNPARLVPGGKDGEVERASDTVLVLAQASRAGPASGRWATVWCAVAKNRAGGRAWCALRFDGSIFDEEPEEAAPPPPDLSAEAGPPAEDDRERA
jgi:replicative DNA helicase